MPDEPDDTDLTAGDLDALADSGQDAEITGPSLPPGATIVIPANTSIHTVTADGFLSQGTSPWPPEQNKDQP